eukprot:scaffold12536_cov19-Prasinocladus_malaysianus.AAC.2
MSKSSGCYLLSAASRLRASVLLSKQAAIKYILPGAAQLDSMKEGVTHWAPCHKVTARGTMEAHSAEA